jgi:hypothetical protein
MLDGNSSMKNSDLVSAFKNLDLEEAILGKHGLDGPATQRRNSSSTPIDGIWKTPGIVIEHGGYFGYDEVFPNTDHRCLWIDVSFISAFGHYMATPRKKTPQRLHCRDPRLIDNFVKLYHQYVAPFNLFERVNQLDERAITMPKHQVLKEYEELDLIRCQASAFAESKCRKLRTGQVAYSPELAAVRNQIEAWQLLLKKKKGQRISSRLLSRSLKRAKLPPSSRQLTEALTQDKLK